MISHFTCLANHSLCVPAFGWSFPSFLVFLISFIFFYPKFVRAYLSAEVKDGDKPSHHMSYIVFLYSNVLHCTLVLFFIGYGSYAVFNLNNQLIQTILFLVMFTIVMFLLSLIALYQLLLTTRALIKLVLLARPNAKFQKYLLPEKKTILIAFAALMLLNVVTRLPMVVSVLEGCRRGCPSWPPSKSDSFDNGYMKVFNLLLNTIFLATTFIYAPTIYCTQEDTNCKGEQFFRYQTIFLALFKIYTLLGTIAEYIATATATDDFVYLALIVSDCLVTPAVISLSYCYTNSSNKFLCPCPCPPEEEDPSDPPMEQRVYY